MDVPPRSDVPPRPDARPAVGGTTPFAPGPVHLPPPPEEHGFLECPNRLRPRADHRVVPAIQDLGQRRALPRDHRGPSVREIPLFEAGGEAVGPRVVVLVDVEPAPDLLLEPRDLGLRIRIPRPPSVRVDPRAEQRARRRDEHTTRARRGVGQPRSRRLGGGPKRPPEQDERERPGKSGGQEQAAGMIAAHVEVIAHRRSRAPCPGTSRFVKRRNGLGCFHRIGPPV